MLRKKILYSTGIVLCFWIATVFVLKARTQNTSSETLPTYFAYSLNETEELKKLSSKAVISSQSLQKWDQLSEKFIRKAQFAYLDAVRMYTYLYNAQRDAAFLSYNAKDCFEGSLDPISEGILRLFIPDYVRPNDYIADTYSEKLATIVLSHYQQRLKKENSLTLEYKIPAEMMAKKETAYQVGIHVAKWIPWIAGPEVKYRTPPPPSEKDPIWKQQIVAIKKAQKNLTEEQQHAIKFWAGLTGPESGDWKKIVNDYLFENDVPLAKMLLVRSMMMIALYDSTIACMHSKYYYHVIRPQVRDPTITYLIPCPNHPSYPSGHSTNSTAVMVIVTHYLPENAGEWKRLAEEAGMSRIWAGIHYPIDNTAGQELGRQIGDAIIEDQESDDRS